jgi:hypothetical protein
MQVASASSDDSWMADIDHIHYVRNASPMQNDLQGQILFIALYRFGAIFKIIKIHGCCANACHENFLTTTRRSDAHWIGSHALLVDGSPEY